MAPTDQDTTKPTNETADDQNAQAADGEEKKEENPKLTLEVKVEEKSACERHVIVMISRDDIERYFSKQFDDLMPKAEVPGFRHGRAPRKLVESKFREQIKDQVKGALLLDCMNQINEEQKFSAISEPDFDFDAVVLPDEGPMKFEFQIEVRPEFELPNWKGLVIERPVREINDEDVDQQLKRILGEYSDLVPVERPIEEDDMITVNLQCKLDGEVINEAEELSLNVKPVLSFPDALVEGFDKLMIGASAGDTKTKKVKIIADAEKAEVRDKEVELVFEVLDVKTEELPKLDVEMLERIGGFESEEEVREAIKSELKRQLEYRQSQSVRQQISQLLTESANWELPKELLKRQSHRELERAVLELRRSGFDESSIRAYQNELRQNSLAQTERALKEHFILESIAEAEKIEETPEDYDHEIQLIALQQNDSPRRIRARLEKRGQMDSLRNQIIERKVIDLIMATAKFKDKKFEFEKDRIEAVDICVSGGSTAEIPEAKYADSGQEKLPNQPERT